MGPAAFVCAILRGGQAHWWPWCDAWAVTPRSAAPAAFEGFGPKVRQWFKGLEADNSRAYFTANRDFYENAIRGQLEALFAELSETFGGDLWMARQHRDIRFSRDKSPYKTNTYGVLHGPDVAAGGLYVSISASGMVAGSGYHVMARDQLDRYREAVDRDTHGPELEKLIAQARGAGLEVWGQSVATAPRGYPKDHERIELLRYKSLALGRRINFGRRISRDAALEFVGGTWRAATPVARWLQAQVGPAA